MTIYKKGQAVQLSKNFRTTEFDCHGQDCCKDTPIERKLVDVLQNVRDHFRASVNVNCGYRCPRHNAEVSFDQIICLGSRGRVVKVVQRFLKDAGLYSGRINGKCERGTESAICKWNDLHGRTSNVWDATCWEEAFPI